MLPLSLFCIEINKVADRPVTRQRVLSAVAAGLIPGEFRGARWFCDLANVPAAVALLEARNYPAKGNGPRAGKARRLAAGAA